MLSYLMKFSTQSILAVALMLVGIVGWFVVLAHGVPQYFVILFGIGLFCYLFQKAQWSLRSRIIFAAICSLLFIAIGISFTNFAKYFGPFAEYRNIDRVTYRLWADPLNIQLIGGRNIYCADNGGDYQRDCFIKAILPLNSFEDLCASTEMQNYNSLALTHRLLAVSQENAPPSWWKIPENNPSLFLRAYYRDVNQHFTEGILLAYAEDQSLFYCWYWNTSGEPPYGRNSSSLPSWKDVWDWDWEKKGTKEKKRRTGGLLPKS